MSIAARRGYLRRRCEVPAIAIEQLVATADEQ